MTIAATRSGKVEGIERDGDPRVPRHPVRRAARRRPAVRFRRARGSVGRRARRDAVLARNRRRADIAMPAMLGSNAAHSSEDRCTSTCGHPACDDAAPAGDGVDPRRRVHARSPATRRGTTARASRSTATSWSSRSTTGSARSASSHLADLFGERVRGSRATRACSIRSPRSSGCATASRHSAAIRTTSRSSASRPAPAAWRRCSRIARRAGPVPQRHRAERRGVVGSARASAPRRSPRRTVERLGLRAGDLDALRAVPKERPALGRSRPDRRSRRRHRRSAVATGDRRQRAPRAAARRDRRRVRGGRASLDGHERARDDAVPDPRPEPRGSRRRRNGAASPTVGRRHRRDTRARTAPRTRRDAATDLVGAHHRRRVPRPGDPPRRGTTRARPGVDVPASHGRRRRSAACCARRTRSRSRSCSTTSIADTERE